MTILARADWWDLLPIRSITVAEGTEVVGLATRGGAAQMVETVPSLWSFDVTIAPIEANQRGRQIEALFDLAASKGNPFEFSPLPWSRPLHDPQGTAAGAGQTVFSVDADGWRITIDGLPVGYEMAIGDWFSVEVAAQAGYRANRLYRSTVDDIANASGRVQIDQVPRADGLVQSGDAVEVSNPVGIGIIEPGSLSRGAVQGLIHGGGTFRIRQVTAEVQL